MEPRFQSRRDDREPRRRESVPGDARAELALDTARLAWWDQCFTTGRVERSPRWAEMLGYAPGEVAGRLDAWTDLVHPEDLAEVREIAARHEAGELAEFEVEHRMRAADGGWRWILNWGRIVERDPAGRPVRAVGVHLDITRRKHAELERERLIGRLERALAEIRTLRGILPICAQCKRIRDDRGYWEQLEVYLREHADLEFSHGLCPDCAEELYPDFTSKT